MSNGDIDYFLWWENTHSKLEEEDRPAKHDYLQNYLITFIFLELIFLFKFIFEDVTSDL